MPRPSFLFFLLLILPLLLPQLTTANDTLPARPSALPGVTLVEGRQIPSLLRQSIATVQVYAFDGDKPRAIPFQIDERDHRNRWVIDQGKQPTSDDSPGVFDENDVLVLADRDLGQRGPLSQLPKGATTWVEIRIGSVVTPPGFAYTGVFATPLPNSSPHALSAHYAPQADYVSTDCYTLGFAGAPLPSHLAFVEHLGDGGTNLIAGVRVIGEVRFLRGLLTMRRTDENIHTEVLGYRQGPIRTIRRARYWIPLPLGFRTNGRIDVMFYRDVVEGTTVVRLKVPPRLILADGELQAYFRFLDLSGARLIVEGQENIGVVDGHMDDAERALHRHPTRWAALTLPSGRTLLLIARLEGTLQRLEQRLYFDDSQTDEAWRGGKPSFGFEFSRVNQLETGTHRLSVFAIALDTTRIDDIRRTVERFLAPPLVTITPLQGRTARQTSSDNQ